jgi:hypothetical protein
MGDEQIHIEAIDKSYKEANEKDSKMVARGRKQKASLL